MELQALCLNTNATNVAFMRHLHRRPTFALTFTPPPRPRSAPWRPATFTPMNDASVSGKSARSSSIVVRAQHRSERSFQEKKEPGRKRGNKRVTYLWGG
jgi:hypothetical protein